MQARPERSWRRFYRTAKNKKLSMFDFQIIADKNSNLAKQLAEFWGKKVFQVEIGHFADSETFIKFSDSLKTAVFQNNIFVVHQFYFSNKNLGFCSINKQLLDFLFLVDGLKKVGAKKVIAFLPYLPYSRQEKSENGDFIGILGTVGKFLKIVGIDEAIVCELHAPQVKGAVEVLVEEVDLKDFWLDFLNSSVFRNIVVQDFKDACFVSPDEGGKQRNEKLASAFDTNFAFIEKTRVMPDQPVPLKIHGDVKDKVVIMVDDIIDTGRTATKACELLLKNGAKKVVGCFSHAVLSDGAVDLIEKSSFDKIFITDTILNNHRTLGKKFSIVQAVPFLANYLSSRISVG